MSSASPSAPLIWIDLEYTDLNVKKGAIVEIATVITNGELEILGQGPDLVINQPQALLSKMVHWNQEHFSESGLMEEIITSKISLAQAEEETLKFIKKYCSSQSCLLAGASVYIDRDFLREYMPKIYNFVHYRLIDTNTIKELMHRWYPNVPDYPNQNAHRAGTDILESIAELKYYREHLFKPNN
jgi:oligoribonuclease